MITIIEKENFHMYPQYDHKDKDREVTSMDRPSFPLLKNK